MTIDIIVYGYWKLGREGRKKVKVSMVQFVSEKYLRREIRRWTILFQLSWVSWLESLRSIALCREIFNLHIARSTIFVCSVVLRIMVWDETLVTPRLATSVMVTRKSVFWKYFLVFSPVKTSVKYQLTGAVLVCSVVRCRITEAMSGGQSIDKERKSPRESGEDSEDESEILEESPCGRWLKRREEVCYYTTYLHYSNNFKI